MKATRVVETEECVRVRVCVCVVCANIINLVLLVGVVEVELAGAEHAHDGVEDAKLTGGESADHEATRGQTLCAQLQVAGLGGDAAKADHSAALATGTGLVDLGEEGVSRVRDDGSHHTGNHAGAERHRDVGAARALLGALAHAGVDLLGNRSLHGELGHGVGHLLEEDGPEARVETLEHALLRSDLRHGSGHTGGEGGVGHELDARGLEGAEEDVGDELSHGGGGKVDVLAVVPGFALAEGTHELDLEELDTAELEPTLDEVAEHGRAEARGKGADTLGGDHLAEAADHALVVHVGLKLDARLDHVNGAHGTVRDAAADAASQRALDCTAPTPNVNTRRHSRERQNVAVARALTRCSAAPCITRAT